MIPVWYCLKGHWDDPGLPTYLRSRTIIDAHREAEILRRRFESVKFCLACGSKLMLFCQTCETPLRHSPRGDAPQHCGGCGQSFPWTNTVFVAQMNYAPVEATEEAATVPQPRVITAPVGHVKAFKVWLDKTWVKISPTASKVAFKVVTDWMEKLAGISK